jgi:hypothetical protein
MIYANIYLGDVTLPPERIVHLHIVVIRAWPFGGHLQERQSCSDASFVSQHGISVQHAGFPLLLYCRHVLCRSVQ